MITAIQYEVQQELVFLDNAGILKDQMAVSGWSCIREKVIDCASGSIELQFQRLKELHQAPIPFPVGEISARLASL